MRDYGVTGMATTAVKVGTCMPINGQDARRPHRSEPDWRQMAVLQGLACDEAIRFKARSLRARTSPELMCRGRFDFAW
jgi:hypothetical protein